MTIPIVLVVIGIVLYLVTVGLMRHYINRFAPGLLKLDALLPRPAKGQEYLWEKTAGTGIVSRWVSVVGLLAIPVLPIGIIWLLIALVRRVF